MAASLVVLGVAAFGIIAVLAILTSHIWTRRIQHRNQAKRAMRNLEEEYWDLVGKYK